MLALSALLAATVTPLTGRDFQNGTLRITAPGVYRLDEDIEFAPRADNNYWNVPGDPRYPMHAYYLGFFAGITVEADGVEIDLNGHTIKQSKEFYLLQRFWNAIELADRVFVDNEGVMSLNYQKDDKVIWTSGARVPGIRSAKNVYIHDGVLGLASHSGIHGNGASGVRIHNVIIRDWEVSGFHCNGCEDIEISSCTIGPTSSQVPVLATFSNARFMELYAQRLIPHGLARETPSLSHLLDHAIAFADRPNETFKLVHVFDRMSRAVKLFVDDYMGRSGVLSTGDTALMAEARRIFVNHAHQPDGGVAYGILINHLGLPEQDENYYGAGLESRNVVIRDTSVAHLAVTPVPVPGLQTADGTFVQGVARDLLRIYDIVSDDFRSLVNATYRGNFLADAYFAFWKLSNDFYVARVYQSSCGNFGSNSTLPWTFGENQCAAGVNVDPSLKGRDVTLLQKKYFGGITMSQQVFEWATQQGKSLHKLFLSQPDAPERRQSKHFLACDQDTMFHAMQGLVAIKLRWTLNATLSNVRVFNLTNLGDDEHWVCRQKYRLPENGEDFSATRATSPRAGAAVHGILLVKSEQVLVKNVSVEQLYSDEGSVVGIEVQGDTNDRTMQEDREAVSFDATLVHDLRAGHGSLSHPIKLGEDKIDVEGITTDQPVDVHNNFKQPKAFLMYEIAESVLEASQGNNQDKGVIDRWMARSSFNTEEKLHAFRVKCLGFLTKQYGLTFHEPEKVPLREAVWVAGTDSFVAPTEVNHAYQYKGVSICTADGGCQDPCTNCFIHDFNFLLTVGAQGLMLHGAFGGDAGLLAPAGNLVYTGMYLFEGITLPGTINTGNLEVAYFGLCPLAFSYVGGGVLTVYIDCMLESDLLGHGRATGSYIARPVPNSSKVVFSGYPTMVFDDTPVSPLSPAELGAPKTDMYAQTTFGTPDVAFYWLADGTFQVPKPSSQVELLPGLAQHAWIHEAGTKFLQRWTSLKTDSAIRQLRYDFMKMLHDDFGIAAAEPEQYLDEPITNQIDLGGGNTIQPYVVNHWSNQRVITKRNRHKMRQFSPDSARLHEGGFRLFVGRAGMSISQQGEPLYLPYGSMLLKGVYVITGDPDLGSHEINFTSSTPIITNEWSTISYELDLWSHVYGVGKAHNTVPMPHDILGGLQMNSRGALVFYNGEGSYPGWCEHCPIEQWHSDSINLTPPKWEADDSGHDALDKRSGLDDGTVIGIAVGCFVVGAALATALVTFILLNGTKVRVAKKKLKPDPVAARAVDTTTYEVSASVDSSQ